MRERQLLTKRREKPAPPTRQTGKYKAVDVLSNVGILSNLFQLEAAAIRSALGPRKNKFLNASNRSNDLFGLTCPSNRIYNEEPPVALELVVISRLKCREFV